jgi:hypothetical protein
MRSDIASGETRAFMSFHLLRAAIWYLLAI